MPKSPEKIGGQEPEYEGVNIQEVLSANPENLKPEQKQELVNRFFEDWKKEKVSEFLSEVAAEIRGEAGAEVFKDTSPFGSWIMGEKVDPEDTVYPFPTRRERENREQYISWMKAFLERVKEETNKSGLPRRLDFDFEEDAKGTVRVVLKNIEASK